MHYYKRDIGKYYKKAGRLTMLQHGAYTMLMDACYDREVFPNLEQAIDWCWASTNEEIEAVKLILSKFFIEHDGVFKQRHITEILDKYHETAATNKATALKREADKRAEKQAESTKREQTVNESTTNEHLIKNYELGIKNKELKISTSKTASRFDDFWKTYPKKKEKKKTLEIWKRRKLDNIADKLISDISNRKTNDQNWIDGYIPNPTTYLNGDRWEDEIKNSSQQNGDEYSYHRKIGADNNIHPAGSESNKDYINRVKRECNV